MISADEILGSPAPAPPAPANPSPPSADAILDAPQGPQEAPATPQGQEDPNGHWQTLYSGLDTLDSRVSPDQRAAFAVLDKTSANPKEARAKVINQMYVQETMPDMPKDAVSSNWNAVKNQWFKTYMGVDKMDASDTEMYGYIKAHLDDLADPEQVKSLFHADAPQWDTKPLTEFGGEVDVEKIKNPAGYVAASVWNGIQPALASMTSVQSVLSLGGAAGLAAKGPAAAKPILAGIFGLFGALMAKNGIEAIPGTAKIVRDPNETTGEKIRAVTANITDWLMAFGASYGAAKELAPSLPHFNGTIPQAADAIDRVAAQMDTPLSAVDHLRRMSQTLRHLAETVPEAIKRSEAGQVWDEVKQVLAPASRGAMAAATAGALREHGGELARRTDIAEAALKSAGKVLMKMDPADRWKVVDDIEQGKPQPNPELQGFADTVRAIMDTRRKEIQDLGTGKLEHFIEDYFPHIWKDPEKATNVLRQAMSKAPLEGSKSFLKQRTIPTIREGMDLGLEPETPNPVEMVLLRAREMDKYILGQKWMAEMKDKDFVKFVRSGDDAPEGFIPINDKIARVYGPKETGYGKTGEYYAPSEVATVANNYLSPGLRKYASFRAYLSLANSMNQFQLGLSAFHLGFVSLDTSVSKLSLAIEQATQGKFGKAAASAVKVPTAPFTTAIQGNKVLAEWSRPGTQGAEIAKIADAYMKGGGRGGMDQFYQTNMTKAMLEMFSKKTVGGTVSGIWRAPFAALEQVSKPLMSWLVPRMKAGVAADMIRMEMEKHPNWTEEQERAAFDKVVDSVDNRMGQMVYDNLFWKKTAKDALMASVRSVGWNLGTIRELGGGVKDTAAAIHDALTPKKQAEFTHRMGYMIALPTLTGFMGAMYHYLHTGKRPEDMRDLYFPKTGEQDPQGRDVRVALPSYMKDVYHYPHDPVGTIEGKVNPFPSLVMEMLNNKDFFGRDIRNADDPIIQQLKEEAEFLTKGYEPIGIKQYQVSKAAGVSTGEKLANFVGVTRAPAWVGESDAEQLAAKLAGDKFKGAGTPDAELVQKKQNIQKLLREGKEDEAEVLMDELEDAEKLTPTQRKNLIKGTDRTYLENALSHLDAKEAMRVFTVATPDEREAIEETVRTKIDKAHIPDDDRDALEAKLESLLPKEEQDKDSKIYR